LELRAAKKRAQVKKISGAKTAEITLCFFIVSINKMYVIKLPSVEDGRYMMGRKLWQEKTVRIEEAHRSCRMFDNE